MLKSILHTIFSFIMIAVTFLAAGKFAYDVYSEVNQMNNPFGLANHIAVRTADDIGIVRQSPYRRAVSDCAREIHYQNFHHKP